MNNKEKNIFFGSEKPEIISKKKRTVVEYFSNDLIIVRIIFFVGILSIVFGIWKVAMQIKSPFIQSQIVLEDKEPVIKYLNRLKDTDGDGISDYEEEYLYGTSPYLIDTDSDGISDYDEILQMASSENNCSGGDCNVGDATDIANLISSSSTIPTTQTFTIEDIKISLIQAGYSEAMVNQLSKEDLDKIYEEVIKAANDPNYKFEDSGVLSGGIDAKEATNISAEDLKQLENLSPEEIRRMMIEQGAEEEKLNQISDEDLKQIYLDALSESQIKQ